MFQNLQFVRLTQPNGVSGLSRYDGGAPTFCDGASQLHVAATASFRFDDRIAGRERDFFHFGILADFFARHRHDRRNGTLAGTRPISPVPARVPRIRAWEILFWNGRLGGARPPRAQFPAPSLETRGMCSTRASNTTAGAAVLPIPNSAGATGRAGSAHEAWR